MDTNTAADTSREQQTVVDESAEWDAAWDEPKTEAEDKAEADEGTDQGEADTEDAPANQADATVEADPWKDAPEHLRKAFTDLKAQQEKQQERFQHQARSDAGRIAAFQRQLNEFRNSAQTQPTQGQDTQQAPAQQPTQAQASKAIESAKDWANFKEDYPQFAEALEQRVKATDDLSNDLQGIREYLGQIDTERYQQHVSQQLYVLEQTHPDYRDVAVAPEFRNWLQAQPPSIQQLAGSNDATEVSFVLSSYKSARSPGTETQPPRSQPRKQRLVAAESVRGKGPSPHAVPDDDWDAAWDAAKVS